MYVTSEVSYIFVIVGVYVIHTTPIFVDRAPRHVACDSTKKRKMNTKRKKPPRFTFRVAFNRREAVEYVREQEQFLLEKELH